MCTIYLYLLLTEVSREYIWSRGERTFRIVCLAWNWFLLHTITMMNLDILAFPTDLPPSLSRPQHQLCKPGRWSSLANNIRGPSGKMSHSWDSNRICWGSVIGKKRPTAGTHQSPWKLRPWQPVCELNVYEQRTIYASSVNDRKLHESPASSIINICSRVSDKRKETVQI